MPQNYEIAGFNPHTPFRCVMHHIGHIPSHMHDYFEILFILSGACSVTVENQLISMHDGDLLVVEGHTPHELRASDCVYASVQLDQATLENNFPVPIHPSFSCNSTLPGNEIAFDRLRRVIARLIQNNADEQDGFELRNWILIYQLMDVLYTYFRVKRSEAVDRRNHRYVQRIAELSSIINNHYTEDLPLSKVADMVHLSVPYLSKFFQEQFGIHYLAYLTQLRINHAVHELVNTSKNIEEIAADSGFPNSHAFTKAFQQEYGCMPSVYRRRQRSQASESVPGIDHSDYLSSLRKYLDTEQLYFSGSSTPAAALPPVTETVSFSFRDSRKQLAHTWKHMIAIGKAADILVADIQKILIRIQKEIGFHYLFFNGILSDELHVCSRNSEGMLVFNFAYVDRILDFLTEIGLVPMLSLSYMPSAIAKDPDRRLFSHAVSEPAHLSDWLAFTEAFTSHVIRRYGLDSVRQWKFTVWHQPNTTPRLYGFKKDEDFYVFFRETRRTVKEVLPGAAFGFPPVFQNADLEGDAWFHAMISWCREQDCLPDFLNFTYYDTRMAREERITRQTFGFVFTMVLNHDPDGLKSFITHIRQDCLKRSLSHVPVYLSEWNNTPSQQDLLNDTCYKSCYITKSIIENYDRLDGLAYWCVSDLMSEAPLPENLLFGGLGLFTANGLPKASYYAFYLLSRLGDQLLGTGNGWIATRTSDEIRIMACHYVHVSRLYASGERFVMTPEDRYTMFQSAAPRTLHVKIKDLSSSGYTVREYLVGRKGGSLYDAWEKMGWICPDQETDRQILASHSMPSVRQYTLPDPDPDEDGLQLTIELDPLDVKLLILEDKHYRNFDSQKKET